MFLVAIKSNKHKNDVQLKRYIVGLKKSTLSFIIWMKKNITNELYDTLLQKFTDSGGPG